VWESEEWLQKYGKTEDKAEAAAAAEKAANGGGEDIE